MSINYSNLEQYADELANLAKKAGRNLRTVSAEKKAQVLRLVAERIRAQKSEILAENAKDCEAFKDKLSEAMLDRLTLNDARIEAMAKGAEEIAEFTDPLGRVLESRELPNGIQISRVAVPMGAIFFIYESRPNVTIDGACLCFKSGNAVVLRGGKESLNSSKFLAGIFRPPSCERSDPARSRGDRRESHLEHLHDQYEHVRGGRKSWERITGRNRHDRHSDHRCDRRGPVRSLVQETRIQTDRDRFSAAVLGLPDPILHKSILGTAFGLPAVRRRHGHRDVLHHHEDL